MFKIVGILGIWVSKCDWRLREGYVPYLRHLGLVLSHIKSDRPRKMPPPPSIKLHTVRYLLQHCPARASLSYTFTHTITTMSTVHERLR